MRLSIPLVAESEAMREVLRVTEKAARSTATVLLRGETGTGKDVLAQALHELGPRGAGPLVTVDCAALPDHLLESELFGFEKGAFSGATAAKPGRVEGAAGGTLFLDEIGDLPLGLQPKVLRLIQHHEFQRLGSVHVARADLRVIAATHRPLEQMVEAGEFRSDLFYRLSVLPIWLPPLRSRRDDIMPLAKLFARRHGEASGRPDVGFDDEALRLLRRQRWVGNVRELQNLVERLVTLADGAVLGADVVAAELERPATVFSTEPVETADVATPKGDLARAEHAAIVAALEKAGGNKTLAARILGVSRSTLYAKLAEYGLGVREAEE